ncbi:bifunctional protein-disulfide isomerase/oxidoreductase DsbC [Shewanella avicenniae]|uniref:Thiol:disulfide interchange protein n=1 Tax=Shewanella avicenniae TaxID=2814294 RepID=A0ABX7QSJ1_9GAMM|nr:bifunctional protein-disulfide isomerase/oxidoreductase DsbC [Shewanella avicenniae]QSX34441.1 bifunctional protein-disulfide isomerase/oxidoreductase DsbC [Shewanella avicenniae]
MKLPRIVTLCLSLAVAPMLFAATPAGKYDELKQQLTDRLGIEINALTDSPIEGLLQAVTSHGILYVSADGTKLMQGTIYDLKNRMNNLTEAAMAQPRLEQLKPFENEMLVYKAKNEKHVVTVFTDITCGYCRKLHQQMQEYNDLGITVRYMAYPRAGVPSKVAEDMESIWCAKDPLKAMDDAKAGKSVPSATCKANIAAQYNLGVSFGINGTPSLILENGTMLPGYMPPEKLNDALSTLN